nr:MAG TPA: Helix-turn-helix XRE-family like protein [Bacteriophage sp.]
MSRKIDTYRRLRALMLELGHDQTSLGKRTGMSRQQISDRMICKTPWTLEEVYKVCDALFIPIKDVKKFFPPNGVEKKEEQHGSNNQHLYPVV